MNYYEDNAVFEEQTAHQRAWHGNVPIYPGIGVTEWKNLNPAVKCAEQIEIVRRLGMKGFVLFEFDASCMSMLPELRKGVTSGK